ncbi:hypothetical protein CcrC1_gp472 [Caulobacter phage C1]|nr:hypothetical protein CcrC1_gp472 [Caulobacter phage C1]UTU08682.1 hypothetical protein CcrC2_gp454 [Caulobacter phage C2]WGN97348.1 hypothetical protein [Bertelyvirus sp.]WGN97886.1 hypothetical protein [Bertelyvirus sp.]
MAHQFLHLIDGRRFTTSEAEDRIVQDLPIVGVGRTAHRLVRRYGQTDLTAPIINRMLMRLSRQGRIARLQRGVYAPLPKDTQ